MGFFKGNIGNSYTENHVFIILDKSFQDNGVGSLTKSGYDEFVQTDFGKSVLKARMDASGATNSSYYENIIQLFGLGSGSCKIWDGSDYVTKSFSEGELLELIDYHESGKSKTDQKEEAKDTLITQINSSIQGCVVFKKSGQAILKCYFYSHNTRQNDRVVTQKGSPLITATPRKPSGAKYGYRYTQEKLQEDTSDAHNIGVFIGASSDGDNDVNNTITAPVAYSLDASRGMWTIANQMIVRLATDVDSANIVGFDLTDDLELTTSATWYKSDGEKNASQRATGKAVPMSVQNNNPNTFGPNIKLCNGTKKVEQIPVVNRSNDSFKSGDVAIVSLIDGEWILQKFGTLETKPQPTSIGRWGFTKLIANSDWFFRNRVNNNQLLPPSCQDLLRNKFFKTLAQSDSNLLADIATKTEISALNMVGDYVPVELNYYIQTSSFDQTKPEMGGTASMNYYKNINIEYPTTTNVGDMPYFSATPLYWGPVFPDGYASAGHARMRTREGVFTPYKISPKSIDMDSHNDWYFSTGFDIAPIPNANLADSNFMQLPADIATNGKYGGDGFPLEDTADIIRSINSDNFASAINKKLEAGYAYYLGDYEKRDVYGLKPNNPLRLQFTPLSSELAGADDVNTPNLSSQYIFNRYFRKNIQFLLSAVGIEIPLNFEESLFGNLYTRLKSMALGSLVSVEPTTCGGVYDNALVGPFDCIPYDCYVKLQPLNKPRASMKPYYNPASPAFDGANLVGITAARNQFTKNKGGTMNISAKQVFGVYGPSIGGGAGTLDLGLVIIPISSSFTPSPLRARFLAAWGSTNNDSIDSFGTTALHAMVWDYWPEQQTVFIPQYFTVLHFNPGKLLSSPETDDVKYKLKNGTEITVKVDKIEHDVDFRVPTFDESFQPVPAGTIFTKDGPELAPQNMWKVNTVRRGQLVTNNSNGTSNNGFLYYKLVIGLSKDGHSIEARGSGFSIGDKVSTTNGVTIEIKQVDGNGSIVDFEFAEDKTYSDIAPNAIKVYKKGEGYSASSFPTNGQLKLTFNSPSKKEAAIIIFTKLEAYKQVKLDVGPKMRCPITKLSSSSYEGTIRVEETKNTTLNIEDNTKSKYPNKYEAFYFCHNDIGHVFNTPDVDATPNFAQHITITIS